MKKKCTTAMCVLLLYALMMFSVSCEAEIHINNSPRTPTQSITSTSTSIFNNETPPSSQTNYSCTGKWPSVTILKNSSGSLLYFSPESKNILAYDFNSGHSKTIPGMYLFIDVSFDHSMFSHQVSEKKEIEFVSKTDTKEFSVPENLYSDGFTVNNDLQLGVSAALDQNYQVNVGTEDQYYLLSPVTGSITFHSVFLPYYKNVQNSYSKYSPDLNYVVYPSFYQGNLGVILLAIETGEIKWSGWSEGFPSGNFPIYPKPIWKPDSSAFTIVMSDHEKSVKNIFNISIAGRASQLTHFENKFGDSNEIGLLTWSPNNRYLALRLDFASELVEPSQNNRLVIIDSQTGKIFDPCLSLGRDITHPIGYPVWSPDGNKIAMVPANGSGVVIVDLETEKLFRLIEKTGFLPSNLLAWMSWEMP